ncbi:hypothetical protein CROQUDRAFT_53358 [Cronartium quercuum f. sp. fusiforme G11]|uniref:DUF7872 domain-containing protein n=1 Tax=Cronartium quercuum f. sp. fusiforme G11 TaxID=708437 RepID=A0A9P6N6C3_9BASI|nr:hypothetical protein CROQUDRAFT_53358 [Cronartium quercuum f. sp. fusiforme G11]
MRTFFLSLVASRFTFILTHSKRLDTRLFGNQLNINSTLNFTDLIDLCESRPLTPTLWEELDMNRYLKDYNLGDSLSLPDFADLVGASNFDCGIGKFCDPSDLCAPVKGRAWYALVAARRWNIINNALYSAIPLAVSVASEVTPSMVLDLIPDASTFWTESACLTDMSIAILSVIPGGVFRSEVVGNIWGMMFGFLNADSGWSWTESNVLVSDPPKYEIWEDIVFSLEKFQKHMQAIIANSTSSVIQSGISTKSGLSGINSDGHLFLELSIKSVEEIRKGLVHDLRLRSLSLIFGYQKAFIVRGAEPCIKDGPGGSLDGPDTLSICDQDNVQVIEKKKYFF